MTEFDRTYPKCTSAVVTRYVNSDHQELGFECHTCGTIWAELERTGDGIVLPCAAPATTLADLDPMYCGETWEGFGDA